MQNSFSVFDARPVPVCAFVTDDAAAIINYAADGTDCGLGSALVTLVEIRGGAARAIGAQMAVRGDGSYCGYISGGCTEAAVAAEAITAISKGTDGYLSLGEGSPFFDISLPCGGGITLAIHVIRDVRALRQVLTALEGRRRIALHYVPGTQTITAVKAPTGAVSSWSETAFLRVYRPNLRLILCGRGIELESTTRVAMASEFEVFAFDQKSRDFEASMIDQDTAVAVLYHDLDQELPWFEAVLRRKPFYIGALGSRRTHERRCQALRDLGYSSADAGRIKAPIGLFGPTRDANALALSVVAEVAQAFSLSQN